MRQFKAIFIALFSLVLGAQSLMAASGYDALKEYEAKIGEVESVEQIDSTIVSITEMMSSLSADQQREAKSISKSYSDLYGKIKIEKVLSEVGKEEICFILNERAITTNQQPKIDGGKTNDLVFAVGNEEYKSYVLTYDYYKCKRGKTTVVKLTFNFGSTQLVHSFSFDVADFLPTIKIAGNMSIVSAIHEDAEEDEPEFEEEEDEDEESETSTDTGTSYNDETKSGAAIVGAHVNISLELIRCTKLVITSVYVTVPGVVDRIGMNNLKEEFEMCESCDLSIYCPDRFEINQDQFQDYNRLVTVAIKGMMNDRVPLNEIIKVNCETDW